MWDVFAVSTYATVSLVFWYIGLIPDLASLRDKTDKKPLKVIFGALSLGWRGSAFHWQRYEMAYLLLAGLSTPLVLSVHTIVSFDFAVSVLPGWHSTIFPPYFVAGAVYAGFAMVLTLMLPLRAAYGLQDFITRKHLDNMAKVMLATGLVVAYGYLMEGFTAWYSGSEIEIFVLLKNRMGGPYRFFYWMLITCNVIIPQILWMKKTRGSVLALFLVAMSINVGMWLERFIIIVGSLHRDFVPSSWGMFYPTIWDWGTYLGTIGLFMTLIFLFVRVLPIIAATEMKLLLPESGHHGPGHEEGGH
jgi:molybdopterin-containing oxidoreductase family membrane subunit